VAKKAFETQRKAIGNSLAKAFIDYLQERVYKGLDLNKMSQRLGLAQNVVHNPWWQDIPQICDASHLDLGFVVRDSKGHEITFWPERNYGDAYEPPKIAKKALQRKSQSGIETYTMNKDGTLVRVE